MVSLLRSLVCTHTFSSISRVNYFTKIAMNEQKDKRKEKKKRKNTSKHFVAMISDVINLFAHLFTIRRTGIVCMLLRGHIHTYIYMCKQFV